MSKNKYNRAIVNCRTLQSSALPGRLLPKGTVVEGDDLTALMINKAEISEDPDSGAPLVWDLTSKVISEEEARQVLKNAEAESRKAAEREAEIAAAREAKALEKQRKAEAEAREAAEKAEREAKEAEEKAKAEAATAEKAKAEADEKAKEAEKTNKSSKSKSKSK